MFKTLNIIELQKIKVFSKILKDRFKDSESEIWTASTFSAELCLQTTHVLCSITNLKRRGRYIGLSKGTDKGPSDEIADVLFNVVNLANYLDISLSDMLTIEILNEGKRLDHLQHPHWHAINLAIQAGNLWDATAREEGFKHRVMSASDNKEYIRRTLAGILITLACLANKMGIDLIRSFWEMHKDATQFLNEFKNKHKIEE